MFRPSHQIPAHLNQIIRSPSSQPLTEFEPIPITRIRHHRTNLQTPPFHHIDQIQSQLGFRFEDDLLRAPSLLPPNRIMDPFLRKVQSPIQWGTRFFGTQIQRHRHLTLGRLSQSLTAFASPRTFTMHMIHSPPIEVKGNSGTGEWYVQVASTIREGNRAYWTGGKYENEFVKEGNEWKFKSITWKGFFRTPYEESWAGKS